ncbi:MAG: four helix bundle protein [Kiritimatiellales bacterium]|jgi:four helix bundle protein
MGEERKGMMRGYKKLRVWQDAKDLYVLTWKVFKKFPIELSRIRSQQLASVDSVHRNISEGYCRRSLKEYIQHLNIALGSLGESASSLDVYETAGHIAQAEFDEMDALTWKLENGLKKLVESLQEKNPEEWSDTFLVKETNEIYTTASDSFQPKNPAIRQSINPDLL